MLKDPRLVLLGRIAWGATALGIIVTVGAVIWWATFYGGVVNQDAQGDLRNAIQCLYSRRGVCGFIPSVARSAGRVAYSPTVFWFGICLILSGVAMKLLLARRQT
jgi:hypothetical protein